MASELLSPEERLRRRVLGLCMFCVSHTHKLDTCTERPQRQLTKVKSGTFQSTTGVSEEFIPQHNHIIIITQINHNDNITSLSAFVDSGADGNLNTAKDLGLSLMALNNPLKVYAANGKNFGKGRSTHHTETIRFHTSALHKEEISFLITTTPNYPIICGFVSMTPLDQGPLVRFRNGQITVFIIVFTNPHYISVLPL